nr:unnamed protein product [Spirometra erinaceieuropaei]
MLKDGSVRTVHPPPPYEPSDGNLNEQDNGVSSLPLSDKQFSSGNIGSDVTNQICHSDPSIMVVLYDFTATLESQLTIKRGEFVRLLGRSPAGDWSEVEAPCRLPYSPPSSSSSAAAFQTAVCGGSYDSSVWQSTGTGTNGDFCEMARGWVPTSYLAVANANYRHQHQSQEQEQIMLDSYKRHADQIVSPPQQQQQFAVEGSRGDWFVDSAMGGFVGRQLPQQPQHPEDYTSSPLQAPAGLALVAYPWYHGAVSRHAGEQLLRSGITGSYLVRESESSPGQLSVTVRHAGRVYHYRISRDSCGWFFITETHRFPTVVQLIMHHAQAADGLVCPLLYPAPKKERQSAAAAATAAVTSVQSSFDDWEIDRNEIMTRHKLGSGQYGDVYEAVWRRYNSVVAVKTLKQDVNLNLSDFLAEAAIMKNLNHKNLVRLLAMPSCVLVFLWIDADRYD